MRDREPSLDVDILCILPELLPRPIGFASTLLVVEVTLGLPVDLSPDPFPHISSFFL